MRNYLLIFPIALLVTYSQLIVKWRSGTAEPVSNLSILQQLIKFMSDPVVLSAYAAALFASLAWLFVVTKLPLTVAFPIYIGVTFAMVLVGGCIFLSESISVVKLIAVLLIFGGIVLGMTTDA
jgi:multidrug transporter EmrE-like cation transporter